MARSKSGTPLAFISEVARYLSFEPEDIQRMIELDGLPAIQIMRVKRKVQRIPLRDFHSWLCKRATAPVPELAKFETFLADFESVRAGFNSRKE